MRLLDISYCHNHNSLSTKNLQKWKKPENIQEVKDEKFLHDL